jgi:Protein of unknown function (DUF3144)
MSNDDIPQSPNRQSRRASAAEARAQGKLDTTAFLKLADKFIDVANRENTRVTATELHMAFLYAAARYNAHVAKVVLDVPNHEIFVTEMTARYQDMLRQHLADPGIQRLEKDAE